jgi:hypothetical protein
LGSCLFYKSKRLLPPWPLLDILAIAKIFQANDEQFDFCGDQDAEVKAFNILICTLYKRPLRIRSIPELRHVISLGDYYLALPQFSAAFTASLKNDTSPQILDGIVENCVELLEIAVKAQMRSSFQRLLYLLLVVLEKSTL